MSPIFSQVPDGPKNVMPVLSPLYRLPRSSQQPPESQFVITEGWGAGIDSGAGIEEVVAGLKDGARLSGGTALAFRARIANFVKVPLCSLVGASFANFIILSKSIFRAGSSGGEASAFSASIAKPIRVPLCSLVGASFAHAIIFSKGLCFMSLGKEDAELFRAVDCGPLFGACFAWYESTPCFSPVLLIM